MTIELDYENENLLRKQIPYGVKQEQGIRHIETENVFEHVKGRRRAWDDPTNHRYVGSRHIYKVEDEKKFLLLVLVTGIKYKLCDAHEPPPWE
jgi:hypothetical protein